MNRATMNVAALAAILCAGGFYFSAPYIASQIESAVQSNDSATLFSYLDVPSLRESFRGEVAASMAAKDEKLPTPHKFGYMGDVMLTGVAANATDKMFVPAALTDWIAHAGSASPGDTASFSRKYRDINTYEIEVTAKRSTAAITLILERRNLFQWKVERIKIKEVEPEAREGSTSSEKAIPPTKDYQLIKSEDAEPDLARLPPLPPHRVSECEGHWQGKAWQLFISWGAAGYHLRQVTSGVPIDGEGQLIWLEHEHMNDGSAQGDLVVGGINDHEVYAAVGDPAHGNVGLIQLVCENGRTVSVDNRNAEQLTRISS